MIINKKNLLVFGLFFVISLILTYPLITNILHTIPGNSGDSFLYLWNQGWLKNCLTNFHNPYITNVIAYPFESNLAFSALTMVNSLAGALLQLFLPSTLAFNIIFLLSLTLASFFMYKLVFYLTTNYLVAFFAGIAFVYNSYLYGEMLGHFNYVSIYLIPLFILYLIKIYKEDKTKNSIIAGIILAASFYNDVYYTVSAFFLLIIFFIFILFKGKTCILAKTKQLLILIITWAVVSLPLLYFSLTGYFSGQYPTPNIQQINLYSPDIRSLFIPSRWQTLYGQQFKDYYANLIHHGGIIYLGYVLLILFIIGQFIKKPKNDFWLKSKPWLIIGGFFLLASLGPFLYLHIKNLLIIPLPFFILHFLPFVNGILVPPRLIIFVILVLVILASFSLTNILEKIKKQSIKIILIILVIGLVVFENFSLPITTSSTDVPNFYQELAKDKNDFTILELPFALSTSFYTIGSVASSSKLEYYQSIHHKKIMSAWLSRVPSDYPNFYNRIIGLSYLINPSAKLTDQEITQIKDKTKLNFEKLNIRYIIIHPEYYTNEQLANTIYFLNKIYGESKINIEGLLIYKNLSFKP